jgi:hypothetical protein
MVTAYFPLFKTLARNIKPLPVRRPPAAAGRPRTAGPRPRPTR